MYEERSFNHNVFQASVRFLLEIDLAGNSDIPFAIPFANYIMGCSYSLPIHTIIIGQNPYPQNIYPEFGAAFSYDESKSNGVTMTVRNIAYDIYNYDETPLDDSVGCFSDSWRLLDRGALFINESVFAALTKNKKNTLSIKEMEAQCRLLHIIIAESYLAGQKEFTCVGMGMKAEQMVTMIRSWYPKDLFKIKTMSCKNPAARDLGDMSSQDVTLGKTAVSKLLSKLVKEYMNMPPKTSAAEKRRNQNKSQLEDASKKIEVTAEAYGNELSSFEERLKSLNLDGRDLPTSIGDIISSSGALRVAIDKHRGAVAAHTVSIIMMVNSISLDTNSLQAPNANPIAVADVRKSPGPRRVPRRVSTPAPMPAVEEVPDATSPVAEPEVSTVVESVETPPVEPSISVTPSRARRRVRRAPSASYAPSDVGTEYTMDTANPSGGKSAEISSPEAVNIKCFADWCSTNAGDTTYFEILNDASETKSANNKISQDVLDYVRLRKDRDPSYDPYEELLDGESESTKWAHSNILSSK